MLYLTLSRCWELLTREWMAASTGATLSSSPSLVFFSRLLATAASSRRNSRRSAQTRHAGHCRSRTSSGCDGSSHEHHGMAMRSSSSTVCLASTHQASCWLVGAASSWSPTNTLVPMNVAMASSSSGDGITDWSISVAEVGSGAVGGSRGGLSPATSSLPPVGSATTTEALLGCRRFEVVLCCRPFASMSSLDGLPASRLVSSWRVVFDASSSSSRSTSL